MSHGDQKLLDIAMHWFPSRCSADSMSRRRHGAGRALADDPIRCHRLWEREKDDLIFIETRHGYSLQDRAESYACEQAVLAEGNTCEIREHQG